MFALRSFLYFALIFTFVISDSSKNLTCRRRPRKLIKDARTCCEIPIPNFQIYQNLCGNLTNANSSLECRLDCLFKAGNVLSSLDLNLAKLHELLDEIFPDSVSHVASYYISFQECIPLVKEALQDADTRAQKCPPGALLYAACAQMKLLKNCPRQSWNATESCEESRKFVTKCESKLLFKRKIKGKNAKRKNGEYKTEDRGEENGDLNQGNGGESCKEMAPNSRDIN